VSAGKCCNVFFAESQSPPSGDAGDTADTDVLDAIFKWRWSWQCQECPVSSVHCVVLCVLVLVEHTVWLATVTDSSLG